MKPQKTVFNRNWYFSYAEMKCVATTNYNKIAAKKWEKEEEKAECSVSVTWVGVIIVITVILSFHIYYFHNESVMNMDMEMECLFFPICFVVHEMHDSLEKKFMALRKR